MANKTKEVKITEELFCLLAEYFILGKQDEEHYRLIESGVNAKWEALYKRQLYGESQNPNLSALEREQARQKYLDFVGMHKDFRWDQDYEHARKEDGDVAQERQK